MAEVASASAARFATFTSLRHPNYRLLWVTTVINAGANWLQQVTLGWLAYDISDSAFISGLVFGIRFIPQLVAGPIGGVLGDRFERKHLLMINTGVMSCVALCFALLLALGHVQVWHLLVFTLVQGLGQAVVNPLRQALVANTVPRHDLMNAIALNSFAFSTMRVIGPSLAGVLIAVSGPALNFGLQSAAFVVTFLLILPLRTPYSNYRSSGARPGVLESFRTGFGFVSRQPTILGLILLSIGTSLLTTPINLGLLPVFARETLHVHSAGLGIMYSFQGVGAVISTLTIATLGDFRHKGLLVVGAILANALAVCLYSQVTVFVLALPLLAMATGGFTAFSTMAQTIIQSITPDELRARVASIQMIDQGLTPLGALIFGAVAQWQGVGTAMTLAGALGLSYALTVIIRFSAVRSYKGGASRVPAPATAEPANVAIEAAVAPATTTTSA